MTTMELLEEQETRRKTIAMQITNHGEKVNTNVMNVAKKGICEEIVQTNIIAEEQTTSRIGGKDKAEAEAKAEAETEVLCRGTQ